MISLYYNVSLFKTGFREYHFQQPYTLKVAVRAYRKYDVYHLNVGRRTFSGLYFFRVVCWWFSNVVGIVLWCGYCLVSFQSLQYVI